MDGGILNETQFTQRVMEAARYYGWLCVWFRPAQTEKGWRTPLSGDKGSPDLLLARDGVVLHVELKSDTGRLGQGQKEWALMLGESYRLWRPRDWDGIVAELRPTARRPSGADDPFARSQPG